MDRAIAAENQRRRYRLMLFKIFLNAYFNAAASEAIDNLRRHVWVKQCSSDHEEEYLCGTATPGCARCGQFARNKPRLHRLPRPLLAVFALCNQMVA